MPWCDLKRPVNKWSRKFHRWGAIATALPLLIVVLSGLMLILKKNIEWIQPATAPATSGPPAISFEQLLVAASSIPAAEVSGWEDIARLDMRLRDGVIKVQCDSGWEVQVCATTGRVLKHAVRRSDLIESIHDGSWFHPKVKLGVFLPSALVVAILWLTGGWLWLTPHLRRR